MTLPKTRWDNGNNACQSARILGELLRRGDVTAHKLTESDGSVTVRFERAKPQKR